MRFDASPKMQITEHSEPKTHQAQTVFSLLFHEHMTKCLKKKPGSPTEPVSANAACVQNNVPESHATEQDVNKPFTLVLSVPCDKEMFTVFPDVTIEADIFPVDRDNDTMHTNIGNEITNITCNAMHPQFTVATEIQNAICLINENSHKCDATGIKFFRFLTSQHPNNCNVPVVFAATCQQCLCSDFSASHFIWVCPSDEFLQCVSDLVCFELEDHPDNEFFDKALPFLSSNVRGAFQLHKQSSIDEKCHFSDTSSQEMDGKWHSSIAIAVLNKSTNLVTV